MRVLLLLLVLFGAGCTTRTLAILIIGFILGFFAAIDLHYVDPPCLLNDSPCEVRR